MHAPEKTLAVVDHNVPTSDRSHGIDDEESRIQVETLAKNARDFGVEYFNELDKRQGIVHVVDTQPDGTCLLYIDRHLVHEVTSPQAFEGLRIAGRPVHAPTKTLAVVDHNVPTSDRSRLPSRFFGRFATSATSELSSAR